MSLALLACAFAAAACTHADPTSADRAQAISGATVGTDQSTYTSDQTVTVSWSGMPGNALDWVAIVDAGSPPDSGFVQWAYINGQASGTQAFTGLMPGSYEARTYEDNSYTVLGSSASFTVTSGTGSGSGSGSGTATVATDATFYAPGSSVTVTYAGMPGNAQDWIAISTAGSDPTTGFVQWSYTGGQAAGQATFTGLAAGSYEARAYLDNSYTVLGSSSFVISASAISTDKPVYRSDELVNIAYTGTPGNAQDWIAVVAAGSPVDSGFAQWTYTNGQADGSWTPSGLPAGDYEARVYLNNTYTVLASAAFTVTGAVVSTDKVAYSPGQDVTISYAGMSTNAQDWIAVVAAGSPANSGFVTWFYTNGQTSGSQVVTVAPGDYELRAYLNNTYTVLANSAFTVTNATVSTSAPTYAAGDPITVNFSGLSGNSNDWVAVAAAGAPATSVVYWAYTGNAVSGSTQFGGLAAGSYEARVYWNNTYTVVATSTFDVQ